ncbi:MAG: N-acetylmuramoyl-L-alanine amidase [Planctomycetota bacterium]|jgi:hypothetical protein
MPRLFLVPLAGGLLLIASCAAPPATRAIPLGLEPPVLSPPGDLSLTERIRWWEDQLPRLSSEDRIEARLLMGELQLEAQQPAAARLAFYEAKGGHLSSSEWARAERGIGLSYFLEGNLMAGVMHLERAVPGLDGPASTEIAFLLAAATGKPMATVSETTGQRMDVYLKSANLKTPGAPLAAMHAGDIKVDVRRSAWGATTMRSNWDRMTTPFRITVHHTAEPVSSTSLAASISEVRDVQSQHMNGRGWADIGYHFLVDRDGRVFEGRPLSSQGAHAYKSNNIGNIGICLLGNMVADPTRGPEYAHAQAPTAKQMEALDRLVAEVRAHYAIPAVQVWGHQNCKDTLCPGPHLDAWATHYRNTNGKF